MREPTVQVNRGKPGIYSGQLLAAVVDNLNVCMSVKNSDVVSVSHLKSPWFFLLTSWRMKTALWWAQCSHVVKAPWARVQVNGRAGQKTERWKATWKARQEAYSSCCHLSRNVCLYYIHIDLPGLTKLLCHWQRPLSLSAPPRVPILRVLGLFCSSIAYIRNSFMQHPALWSCLSDSYSRICDS